MLTIEIYDEDYKEDDFMCAVSIPVTGLLQPNKKVEELWYKLHGQRSYKDASPEIVDSSLMRDLTCPLGALLIGKRCRLQVCCVRAHSTADLW